MKNNIFVRSDYLKFMFNILIFSLDIFYVVKKVSYTNKDEYKLVATGNFIGFPFFF